LVSALLLLFLLVLVAYALLLGFLVALCRVAGALRRRVAARDRPRA
jgi:hypothetical protein